MPAPDEFPSDVLDAAALQRLRDLDPEGVAGLLPRVLETFVSSLERLLAQAEQAAGADRADTWRHVAHTLKSSSAAVGALALSRICAQIETGLRQTPPAAVDPLLEDLRAEARRVVNEITRLLATLR